MSFSRRLSLAVVLATLGVAASPAAAEVRWRSGAIGAPRQMQPLELRTAIAELAGRTNATHVVIHFDGPVDLDRRAALSSAGVELLSYLGGFAYFAGLAPRTQPDAVGAVAGIVAVEPIAPANKLHPDLAAGIAHPWSIVAGGESKDGSSDPVVAVYVLFHRDVDRVLDGLAAVAAHGGTVQSWIHSINGAVVHLKLGRTAALAADDRVMYVEPPLPALTEINDSARARVGADIVNAPPYGLTGAGIDVLVYDGGKAFQHGDLAGRLTIGQSDTSGISDHATHVSCTVAGDGAGSGGSFRGMAPSAEIISYGFEQEGGLQPGFLYTDPGDIEADYGEAIALYGADLSNNSIGSNVAPNGFPCEWEGNYGATGALIDEIARGSLGAPFRIVWAGGNERGAGTCGTTYNTSAPPACAKNHITVGAMNSNDDSVTSFTSWGPCDDGRMKPDISGPGCQSNADGGLTSCSASGGYNVKCGTSMACPSVAGVSALLLEQYRAHFPGEPDFRNSTLKVILAQTAVDLVNAGPDFQTGFGSVRVQPAADLIAEGRFVEAEVAQGGVYTFLVLVGPSDGPLKVTLAWDDAAGAPDVNPVLVNDLDLRVIGPGGSPTYFPWTLDPQNPSAPAVRTQRDGTNNIEQVVIDAPAAGAYTVEIVGFNVAQGATQSFSAAASPSLINCAPAGYLATSTGRISCSGTLDIQVIDCDLNTDDGLVENTTVHATSGSEPAGETVLLTETAPETAAFTGTLPVDTIDAVGTLLVADGQTLSVTYIDADDGAGGTNVPVVREVVVDCTAPQITSVSLAQVKTREATIAVTANEPVRLTLDWGLSCGALTGETAVLALNTSHQIKVAGLQDQTTYYFALVAEDEAGNTTADDNGGSCYTFTTLEIPEFFTERFESGVDLVGRVLTFTPNGSVDFYAACAGELEGELPTDPAGGTALPLGDDQPTSFVIGGGEAVALYGQAYTTVHVGPNGYLTFGAGDSTYDESFAAHFSLPRVAALFDDLNPGTGGTVSWKQLVDRVAVTWLDVPEYNTSNDNTFQIEMFFDGTIRVAWLEVDVSDAIAGLSAGAGVDPDFEESDLSSAHVCGPEPPSAFDIDVTTTIGDPVTVVLTASDDGLPEPASLTFRIVSLPAFGLLADPQGTGWITAAPFDLTGAEVRYEPYPGYGGADAFAFVADDGGVPPEGGPSEPATVSVDINVGGPELVHAYLVDDADPGWATAGDWAFGAPAGGGSHGGDPLAGASGANVYGYNLLGNYANNLPPQYLTTAPIDLSNVDGATLQFQRWLGIESSLKDHAAVQVSADAQNWTTVWIHGGAAIAETAWSAQSYDVSAVADGKPAVRFRWVMGATDNSGTRPGWNIDDIRVSGVIVPTCTAPPTGEVAGLVFVAKDRLEWNTGPSQVGGLAYDTVRADGAQDFDSAGVCVESDGADGVSIDAQVPDPGALFYYLVRAENNCGPGPLGGARTGPVCE